MDNAGWIPFERLFDVPLKNGLTRPKSVRGVGVKMINMGEIFAHSRISNIPMDRVPLSDAEAKGFLLKPFDLLFARQSLVLAGAGKCSIILDTPELTTWESHIIRARLDSSIADPCFYYYFFNSKIGRQAIESIVEQVAAAGIRGSDLAKLLVPAPPLPEQRAIAHILGSLDDKIELNRQMNETLEAMARALFTHWFVDFGPVRAKMEGRPSPGLADDIAALFPDALDAEGKPQGWGEQPLSHFIELIGGGTPKTSNPDYWNGDIPWFSVVDAPSSTDVFVIKTQKAITRLGLYKSSARLLPEDATIISARGTVGKLAMVGKPMAMNQSCYAAVPASGWRAYFIYYLLKNAVQGLQSNTHGSVFDTITRSTFDAVSTTCPSQQIGQVFDSVVTSWMNKIRANLFEAETLAALRDLLLPKLLSGDIRIRDAEQVLEEVL